MEKELAAVRFHCWVTYFQRKHCVPWISGFHSFSRRYDLPASAGATGSRSVPQASNRYGTSRAHGSVGKRDGRFAVNSSSLIFWRLQYLNFQDCIKLNWDFKTVKLSNPSFDLIWKKQILTDLENRLWNRSEILNYTLTIFLFSMFWMLCRPTVGIDERKH